MTPTVRDALDAFTEAVRAETYTNSNLAATNAEIDYSRGMVAHTKSALILAITTAHDRERREKMSVGVQAARSRVIAELAVSRNYAETLVDNLLYAHTAQLVAKLREEAGEARVAKNWPRYNAYCDVADFLEKEGK